VGGEGKGVLEAERVVRRSRKLSWCADVCGFSSGLGILSGGGPRLWLLDDLLPLSLVVGLFSAKYRSGTLSPSVLLIFCLRLRLMSSSSSSSSLINWKSADVGVGSIHSSSLGREPVGGGIEIGFSTR